VSKKNAGKKQHQKITQQALALQKKRNRNKNKYKKELSGTKLIRKKFLRAFLGK